MWQISTTTALVFDSLVAQSEVYGISLNRMETLSLKMLNLLYCKVRQTGNWSSFCFKTVFQPFSGKLAPLGYIFVGVFLFFFFIFFSY